MEIIRKKLVEIIKRIGRLCKLFKYICFFCWEHIG